MEYEIVVVGDTNDADYITEISTITEEGLEKFKPIFEALKRVRDEKKGEYYNNWPNSEYADDKFEDLYPEFFTDSNGDEVEFWDTLINEFDELHVPHSGDYQIHDIVSIMYYPKQIKTTIFEYR